MHKKIIIGFAAALLAVAASAAVSSAKADSPEEQIKKDQAYILRLQAEKMKDERRRAWLWQFGNVYDRATFNRMVADYEKDMDEKVPMNHLAIRMTLSTIEANEAAEQNRKKNLEKHPAPPTVFEGARSSVPGGGSQVSKEGTAQAQAEKLAAMEAELAKARAAQTKAEQELAAAKAKAAEASQFGGPSAANAVGSPTYADVQKRREEAESKAEAERIKATEMRCEAAEQRMIEFMANVVFVKRHCPAYALHQGLNNAVKELEDDMLSYDPNCDSAVSIEGVDAVIHKWTKRSSPSDIARICTEVVNDLRKAPPMDGLYGPLVTKRPEERRAVRQRQCITILGNRVCN